MPDIPKSFFAKDIMAYPIIDLRSTPEGVQDTRRTVLDTKKAVLLPAGKNLSHPSLLPTHSPLSRLAVSLSGQAVLDTTKSKLETQRSVHSKTKSNLDTSLTESKDSKKVAEVESNSISKKTNLTSSDPPASSHPSTSSTTSTSPVSSAVPPSSSKEYKKVRWIPDEERPACALCQNEFGFFLWRHHCRFCGEVVCYYCSSTEREDGLRWCSKCREDTPSTRAEQP